MEGFLRDSLKLELSHEKTLITHARTEAARFLGYEIVTLNADEKHDHRGRRCINGARGLKVPVDVIRAKCSRYTRRGKPSRLAARLQDTDFSIMTQYQAEYRGLVQYYLLAFNVHRLWRLHRVMELSLVRTLANKFKTSVKRIYRKYRKTVEVPHGTQKVLEVIVDRGPKKKPLVARFGGIELRWQKHAILDDHPKEVFSVRSEVVQRLLAQKCELCGVEETCQVHHLHKLADLNRPGRGKKPPWIKRMAAPAARPWLSVKSVTRPFIENDRSGTSSKHRPLASRLRSKDSRAVLRGADGKGRSRLPITTVALRAHEPRHKPYLASRLPYFTCSS